MSRINNREKVSLLKYKISIFFISLILIIFITLYIKRNEISSFNYKIIQSTSEKYGFILKEINILGLKRITEKSIISNINYLYDRSIFLISLDKIEKNISNNQWIKDMTLKIEYPSTIMINIEEKKPIAILLDNNQKYYFLDNFGNKIDQLYGEKNKNYFIVKGKLAIDHTSNLFNILEHFPKLNVTSAEYIGERRWNLEINNIIVKLPEDEIKSALEVLINDILGNFEENDYALIEFIDLRISEKTIIRLKNKENIEIFKEN